jgi:hypothetical protein
MIAHHLRYVHQTRKKQIKQSVLTKTAVKLKAVKNVAQTEAFLLIAI